MNVLRARTPSAGKGKLPQAAVIAAGRVAARSRSHRPRLCGAITHLARPHAPSPVTEKGSSYKSNEKHVSHVGGDDMHLRAVTIQDPNPTIQDPDLLPRFAGGYPIKIALAVMTDFCDVRPLTNSFRCCYALAGQPLPASSNPASHPQPTDLRPALTGFTKSSMTAIA
jgi:hypothetical protein